MNRYVALLRAINVGGRNVKMDALREVFVQLGFHAVDTHLASGNVLFDSNANSLLAVRSRIESALQRALGFEVTCILRLHDELGPIAGQVQALRSRPGIAAANVGFFAEAPGAAGERVDASDPPPGSTGGVRGHERRGVLCQVGRHVGLVDGDRRDAELHGVVQRPGAEHER